MEARETLIRIHTVRASPVMCPEIRLYLITEGCRLWTARPEDLEALGLPEPFWAFAWAGGQCLARYILDHREALQGRSVLDFGAGSGIDAIAAKKAGAASALAADIDPFALDAVRLNAALNGVSVELTGEDVIGRDDGWEVVLVGDMFYDEGLAARVFPWLKQMAGRGSRVLLGDPHRGFLPAANLKRLASYDAPSDIDEGGRYLRQASVYLVVP